MTSTSAATRVGDLASVLVDRVRGHYGPAPRSDDLAAALSSFAVGQRPVDTDSLARVEVAAQTVFRHLELTHAHNLHPQDRSPGWPDPDLPAIRRAGAHITAVHRDPDGTAAEAKEVRGRGVLGKMRGRGPRDGARADGGDQVCRRRSILRGSVVSETLPRTS